MNKFSEYITQRYVDLYTWAVTGDIYSNSFESLSKKCIRQLFGWGI